MTTGGAVFPSRSHNTGAYGSEPKLPGCVRIWVQSDDLRSRVCQNRDWPAYWGKDKRPPSVGWSELKRTKGQEYPATLQWWILMGSWSELKRTEGQRRPCESPTAENLATLQSQFPKDGGAVIRSPNTVMRQRLIRTVRETVNQDSGKDVSAWAPGRPPIEAESAGQQTAGCHPRRQKRRPSGRLGAKVPTTVVVEVERGADESPAENRGSTRRW